MCPSQNSEWQVIVLDLYVGSTRWLPLKPTHPLGLRLVPPSGCDASAAAACVEAAFLDMDQMDRRTSERVLHSFFTEPNILWEHSRLAFEGDVLVGLCLLSLGRYYSRDQGNPYVDVVAVTPEYRGSGLASTLLYDCMRALREDGRWSVIQCHVRRGNVASERLFQKLEFSFWRRDDS